VTWLSPKLSPNFLQHICKLSAILEFPKNTKWRRYSAKCMKSAKWKNFKSLKWRGNLRIFWDEIGHLVAHNFLCHNQCLTPLPEAGLSQRLAFQFTKTLTWATDSPRLSANVQLNIINYQSFFIIDKNSGTASGGYLWVILPVFFQNFIMAITFLSLNIFEQLFFDKCVLIKIYFKRMNIFRHFQRWRRYIHFYRFFPKKLFSKWHFV